MCRRLLVFSAIAFLAWTSLAGCGPSGPSAGAASGAVPGASSQAEPGGTPLVIDLPENPKLQPLYLGDAQQQLHVGDRADAFQDVFPKPPRSFPIDALPPSLTGEFEVRGWETQRQSVAAILTKGRIALVLRIDDRTKEEDIQALREELERRFGPAEQVLGRGASRYWFWDDDQNRLMLSASQDKQNHTTLALALGDSRLMTALRMAPTLAEEDLVEAERLMKAAPTESGG